MVLLDRSGQTTVEYLMLLAVAFGAAYLMVSTPIANFTEGMINNIQGGIRSLVRTAEWTTQSIEPGNPRHPSSPRRVKALHE